MNPTKKKLALVTAGILAGILSLTGQTTIDLNFQGMLSDIQGRKIADEPFDLSLKIISGSDKTVLWEALSSTRTDSEGWFSFSINEISAYLMEDGKFSDPLLIQLELLPNSGTNWLRKGEDFLVSYTLSPVSIDNSVHLKMTRMEGSELVVHTEDHLYAFKDQYPFAYLTGGFLLTDQPPVNEASIEDLKQWLSPDSKMEGEAASRGIKGGFPVGGYRKKN